MIPYIEHTPIPDGFAPQGRWNLVRSRRDRVPEPPLKRVLNEVYGPVITDHANLDQWGTYSRTVGEYSLWLGRDRASLRFNWTREGLDRDSTELNPTALSADDDAQWDAGYFHGSNAGVIDFSCKYHSNPSGSITPGVSTISKGTDSNWARRPSMYASRPRLKVSTSRFARNYRGACLFENDPEIQNNVAEIIQDHLAETSPIFRINSSSNFTAWNLWYGNRFPGYILLLNNGVTNYFSWGGMRNLVAERVLSKTSIEDMVKYLYGGTSKDLFKHFASQANNPMASYMWFYQRCLVKHSDPQWLTELDCSPIQTPVLSNANRGYFRAVSHQRVFMNRGVEECSATVGFMGAKRFIGHLNQALESSESRELFEDAYSMVTQLMHTHLDTAPRISGLQDLHDHCVRVMNTHDMRRPNRPNRPWPGAGGYVPPTPTNRSIPISKSIKELTAKKFEDGVVFTYPEDEDEIRSWGREQSHCLGSYARDAAEGRATILEATLSSGEKIHFTLTIQGDAISQMKKSHNRNPTESERMAVVEKLIEHKVLS